MVTLRLAVGLLVFFVCALAPAQSPGSVQGIVYDRDFEVPLAEAIVTIAETGQRTTTTATGNYVLADVEPGTYTLVFFKEGYERQAQGNIAVTAGALTDVEAYLSGDFTDLEEVVIEDTEVDTGSEQGLLQLRLDSSALIDSISADFLSRAGAGDAGEALRYVAGTTVQDGKFAVIRGLPDRYVNSQLNGIRLPTADADKRAVQLDQFPSAIIENIQVTKTFTPDQQGDASGGAVNVLLTGVPAENIFEFKFETSYNTQVTDNADYLTYQGGGVNFLGNDDGGRDPQLDRIGENWLGAVGVSRGQAPIDFKWSLSGGGRKDIGDGLIVGGFASVFYERDSSFFDDGIDDSLVQGVPGEGLVPEIIQAANQPKTALFDVTRGSELVQWGALGTLGLESRNHSLDLVYLYTRTAEDTATLAEDTRGKAYFFPGYDPDDPLDEGNDPSNRDLFPYVRTETLEYVERTTETTQLKGAHRFPFTRSAGFTNILRFTDVEVDWSASKSIATSDTPDKRRFGSIFLPESFNPGFPPFVPPSVEPSEFRILQPAANFLLGNLQRTFESIEERSTQFAINVKLPFEQWGGEKGFVKFGVFDDDVDREFNQDTFSNFNDPAASFEGDFEDFWSQVFPLEDHPILDGPPFVDVDYTGTQEITAFYGMIDLPLSSQLKLIGGFRAESTDLAIINIPEEDAQWFPEGAISPVALNPGDADVDFSSDDVLPSISLIYSPWSKISIRAAYSETIARQTFKELTPIQQQEFLGGPVFIGNPDLQLAEVTNYDLRLDYTPYDGGLISASWFKKDIVDPIEIVQRVATFTFDTPVNYPEGELSGFEFEIRQKLGRIWEGLEGITVGANATIIDSEVTLPAEEAAAFAEENILAPMFTRDLTNAPEHLFNAFLTFDSVDTGTQFSLFYTIRGDTLVAGAGEADGLFVPSVYESEFDTLNLSISQKLGKYLKLTFKAKNLTNPTIERVYRSSVIGPDVVNTSFTRGIDYSIGLSAQINF